MWGEKVKECTVSVMLVFHSSCFIICLILLQLNIVDLLILVLKENIFLFCIEQDDSSRSNKTQAALKTGKQKSGEKRSAE